jgi:hypothetical protein
MDKTELNGFIDAYCSNVCDYSRDHVTSFMDAYLKDQDLSGFDGYTSIVDALGMWHEAIKFQLSKGLNNDK